MITSINKNNVKQITAIVVDDDIDTLDVFCECLELYQFRIVGKAYNGEKVAELYSKFKPDVVFLDVMMDNYDGIYALEQIRKVDPNAIVIMVTADLTKDTADNIERLKASALIYKPFDLKNVINIVEHIIGSERNNAPVFEQPELLVPHTGLTFSAYPQEMCMVKK
jgi:two-component system, chemotaxis family, chemotaxis protein CheY